MVKIIGAIRADTIDEWKSILDYLIFKGYKWNLDFEGSSKYHDEYFEDGARYIEIWEDNTLTKSDLTGSKNVRSFQQLISEIFFYKLVATSGIMSGKIVLESDNLDELEQYGNKKIRVRREFRLFGSWSVINYKGDLISHSL